MPTTRYFEKQFSFLDLLIILFLKFIDGEAMLTLKFFRRNILFFDLYCEV